MAFALALAVELGLALLLWFIAPILPDEKPLPTTTTFGIDAAPGETEQPARTGRVKSAAKRNGSDRPRAAPPKPIETPPPPPLPAEPLPETFIRMTRPEYRSADIAGKGTAPRPPSERDPAVASESQPGDSPVLRKGPNGEPVYGVGWYRRGPNQAEVGPYISRRSLGRPGKGVVVCRMVADHRVDDCQEVAETPRGSGYSGTVRQAAWQFRLRPPRVGGRERIGELVEITLHFGNDGADEAE